MRASVYALLARYLARPPSAEALREAASFQGGDTPFGSAIGGLGIVAARTDPERVDREYHDLFIGLGRGELLPYASYYLTGFLHEKPLARLRESLRALGIERTPWVKEPEDHIAALMDIMSGLITGAFGRTLPLDAQKQFFDDHIDSWADYFFRDLECAKSSAFYAALGHVGREFLTIERDAFSML